jgi:hypothetical protein
MALSQEAKDFIIKNSEDYTIIELARKFEKSKSTITWFVKRHELKVASVSKNGDTELSEYFNTYYLCPITGLQDY